MTVMTVKCRAFVFMCVCLFFLFLFLPELETRWREVPASLGRCGCGFHTLSIEKKPTVSFLYVFFSPCASFLPQHFTLCYWSAFQLSSSFLFIQTTLTRTYFVVKLHYLPHAKTTITFTRTLFSSHYIFKQKSLSLFNQFIIDERWKIKLQPAFKLFKNQFIHVIHRHIYIYIYMFLCMFFCYSNPWTFSGSTS